MNYTCEEILNFGCFNDIDRHLSEYLSEKGGSDKPLFTAIVMLLSNRIFKGDVCLYPERIAGMSLADFFDESDPDYDKCAEIKFPDLSVIEKIFNEHPACGTGMPLVYDEGKLYFSRFLDYEISLARELKSRCATIADRSELEIIRDIFFSFFPPVPGEIDMQGLAAYLSLRKGLTVISGGPGTGKTSVVVKIIQILIEMSLQKDEEISIALAAPTGKAAARLKESINISLTANPPSESVLRYIPEKAVTIHRLLGYRSYGGFKHNEENPLEYDLVVVDECSMVDLPLMCRLVKGLKPDCRLILLGDRDQLASVEGGAVFGDICDRGNEHGYSAAAASEIESFMNINADLPLEQEGADMRDSLAVFKKSFRFRAESGIGILADMIKRGDSKGVVSAIKGNNLQNVFFSEPGRDGFPEQVIEEEWNNYYSACERSDNIEELIRGFIGSFSILTAVRDGDRGMRKMNSLAEDVLFKKGIIDKRSSYYSGQPLMITRNSYSLNIFNGDIGIVAEECRGVSFPGEEGEFREIPLVRIPEHETAFSMTVHKSQGSEFDNVFVVLPFKWNRVMTRELLYTAVTRARKKVIISAGEEIIGRMIENPVNRSTGLRDRLWQGLAP
jgi:exodeoxyribonuclease V alpha subunit